MKRGTVLISSGRSVQEQEDSEQLQQHDISNTEPRDEDGDVDASLLSATKLQDSAGNRRGGDGGGGCRKLPAEVLSLERIGGKMEVEDLIRARFVHGPSSNFLFMVSPPMCI
ncbi:hypothetical protein T459_05181 [Capsicum annuum]|uniref:Uncharacterized protein n=1 Tax=Capsicum annuum TaxID=4072 RepID=A0A2G3A789_CAPAN|nr:hypothetical protein T459_05181 [Capsicum annuum]